jgi:Rrf2 family protein
MKLSRTVAYAVQATLQLAKSGTNLPVPCSQLASDGKMPERFLLQILRNLVTHGILRSTRGVDGGYTLVRSPSDVSLLEIIEAIEGPVGVSDDDDAVESNVDAPQGRLHHALQEVAESMRQQLSTIKIAHLLASPNHN